MKHAKFYGLMGLIAILGWLCVSKTSHDQAADKREAAMSAAIAQEFQNLHEEGLARIRWQQQHQQTLPMAQPYLPQQTLPVQPVVPQPVWYVPTPSYHVPTPSYRGGYDIDPRFPQGGEYRMGTAIPG
jgi:hypothetical protein